MRAASQFATDASLLARRDHVVSENSTELRRSNLQHGALEPAGRRGWAGRWEAET